MLSLHDVIGRAILALKLARGPKIRQKNAKRRRRSFVMFAVFGRIIISAKHN